MATANEDGGGAEAQQRAKAPKQAAEMTAEIVRKSKVRVAPDSALSHPYVRWADARLRCAALHGA